MRLDPNRLLVLQAVAETGGVAAAARKLHLVPSGVSQHLAALERETGLALVDRSQRGGQRTIALTGAGRRLAEHAARIRSQLDDAEADVAALADEVHGNVVVSAFPSVLRRLVLPAHGHLADTAAGVQLKIVELDEEPAVDALHAGEVDVALLEADAQSPGTRRGIATERLLEDRYRVAIPADWARPRTLADLGHQPWIEGPPRSVTAAVLRRHRRASGRPFAARHLCLEYPAVLDLVDAGLGAALVPDLALGRPMASRVAVLDLPGLGGRVISAAWLRRRRPRPEVAAVVDALRRAAERDER